MQTLQKRIAELETELKELVPDEEKYKEARSPFNLKRAQESVQ